MKSDSAYTRHTAKYIAGAAQYANGGNEKMEAREHTAGLPFGVNEHVMYRKNGICRITDIRRESFGAGQKLYYILKPLHDDALKIYAPVDFTELARHMRRVLSADEIDGIIAEAERSCNRWIEDSGERAAAYEQMLNGADRADVLWLVKTMSQRREELRGKDRRLTDSDKKILTTAEKLITDEFAFALGIEKSEVVPYILGKVKSRGKEARA